MENQQNQGSGSDWQRQAVNAALSNAPKTPGQQAAPLDAEETRQRAAAQDVPDMFAAVDPQPVQPQAQSGVTSTPQSNVPDRPVFGNMGNDALVSGTPITGTGGTSTAKKLLIGFAILLAVIGGGAGGYFMLLSGSSNKADQNAKDANQQQKDSEPIQSVALESLSGASLVAPPNILSDYDNITENPDGYFFTYQSKTDNCSIIAGIASQDKLPAELQGKTTDQIIESWMQAATLEGVMTVARTSETSTLTLRDADDNTKGYALPTVYYTATVDSSVEHYAQSLATLKDGRLAMIVRWCGALEGNVDATLARHDAKVKEFTVRIESSQ